MLIDMAKLERTRAARAGARIIALASLASFAFLAAASLTFAPAFAQTGPAATAAPGPVPGAESAAAKPRAPMPAVAAKSASPAPGQQPRVSPYLRAMRQQMESSNTGASPAMKQPRHRSHLAGNRNP